MPDGHIAYGLAINNIVPDGGLKSNDSLFGCSRAGLLNWRTAVRIWTVLELKLDLKLQDEKQ